MEVDALWQTFKTKTNSQGKDPSTIQRKRHFCKKQRTRVPLREEEMLGALCGEVTARRMSDGEQSQERQTGNVGGRDCGEEERREMAKEEENETKRRRRTSIIQKRRKMGKEGFV